MKRSYRYRILSPVICLLSFSYLARQKHSLSQPAGVCVNVEPLQIVFLFGFFVLHPDRLVFVGSLILLCRCVTALLVKDCVDSLRVLVRARRRGGEASFDSECS